MLVSDITILSIIILHINAAIRAELPVIKSAIFATMTIIIIITTINVRTIKINASKKKKQFRLAFHKHDG